jgi:hypothetical protein
MKSKHSAAWFGLGLSVLVGCGGPDGNADPESGQADIVASQTPMTNSGWEGTFRLGLVESPIRVAFLDDTSDGTQYYFHKVLNSSGLIDAPCQFTPRAIRARQLFIYPCATSEVEELSLERNPARKADLTLNLKEFTLSPDGSSLHIVALVGFVSVDYQLRRQPLAPETLESRASLRAWLES